ncbi:MAG: LysR family transcriptional regulator [Alphaproteobacteria bacterium]
MALAPLDSLSGMAVFAKVVEARSFTAAAAELGMSKSAVSKQISRLEDRLGARLLNRTTRRLSLTETGAAFYDRCARVVAEAQEAELAVTNLQSEPRGTLRVNAPMSFGHLHIAPAIPDFLTRYPEVRVDMTMNDRFVDLIDEGFDVAIRIARLTDSSLIARRLAPDRRVLCGAPAYFAKRGEPRTPDDLAAHNCLSYAYVSDTDQWQFIDGEGTRAVSVRGNLRANNGDAIRQALLAGLGVAVLPAFIVGPDVQAGRLREVLSDYLPNRASVYAVYPHSRHLSAKVRVFVDFLADRFGPSPYWDAPTKSPS